MALLQVGEIRVYEYVHEYGYLPLLTKEASLPRYKHPYGIGEKSLSFLRFTSQLRIARCNYIKGSRSLQRGCAGMSDKPAAIIRRELPVAFSDVERQPGRGPVESDLDRTGNALLLP